MDSILYKLVSMWQPLNSQIWRGFYQRKQIAAMRREELLFIGMVIAHAIRTSFAHLNYIGQSDHSFVLLRRSLQYPQAHSSNMGLFPLQRSLR